MSLKAKIEAVIYASEEPVTLAQLMGLLGHEAQAELDRMESRQQDLGLETSGDEDALGSGVEELLSDGPDMDDAEVTQPTSENPDMGHPVVEADAEAEAELTDAAIAKVSAAEKRAARERERKLREFFREILDELIKDYAVGDRGLEVREVAGGFRLGTKPEYHDAVRGFVRSLKPALKLSLQALETLAVVAYKQPVTAPEVSEIRGVDSGGVLGSLMGRKLITTAGRKQVIGRPILYKTTKDFLLRFGLKDISELPSIEEFEKMAGELVEQEEIPMPRGSDTDERVTHENLMEEKDATEPQADGDSDDLGANNSNLAKDDLPTLDGRESGLPPTYDEPGDDPSADEAAIQAEEGK
ncbi:SMC-Scp complex subunit ScpB [Granulicella tundricola]|uniref:Chromosome segregation and condensation protein, ScpB n=1 Tax=Granulicella tundricola (strain ATCC BAA-1859 / DSM 23138 / MP5ACTX9) TaxID=1198114 RepID=E8WYN3_GRATM|nr:SMC-Scp complex subunit ScpB [Granulicella tundricola]ADW67631.1 chromosome segregation and condensation protein, ScpB [Granulicella tundricola MP5ACTX9]